jgi:hypothetical protein
MRFLWTLLMLAAPAAGSAQVVISPARRIQFSVAAGPTVRGAEAGSLGEGVGFHVQVSGTRWLTRQTAARLDVSVHIFPAVAAIPDCLPGAPCEERRDLSRAGAACARVVFRPTGARWVYVAAGPGAYWAGTDNWRGHGDGSRSTATAGMNGALGVSVPRRDVAAIRGEVSLHYFPAGLGELRWILAPAIAVTF